MWEIREFLSNGFDIGWKRIVESGFASENDALKRKFELEKVYCATPMSVFKADSEEVVAKRVFKTRWVVFMVTHHPHLLVKRRQVQYFKTKDEAEALKQDCNERLKHASCWRDTTFEIEEVVVWDGR